MDVVLSLAKALLWRPFPIVHWSIRSPGTIADWRVELTHSVDFLFLRAKPPDCLLYF